MTTAWTIMFYISGFIATISALMLIADWWLGDGDE